MKTTMPQRLKLGIFVITGTILFVIAVYLIGDKQHMFKNKFTINTHFQNISGLQKGNNVRYSGINIGTVTDITMINDSTIKIKMGVDEKIIKHIRKNAIATIGSDGLVGNMIVNIVPGKGISPSIADGDTIQSYSKIGTDDILNTLSVTNENAAILTSDLLTITNSIIEGKGTLGILLNDTIMAYDLKQSVTNLKLATNKASLAFEDLNTIINSLKSEDEAVLGMLLNDTISGKKMKDIIHNLELGSAEIRHLIKDVNIVVDDLNSSQGTYHYIAKDTALVNSLKATFNEINEGASKFNQNMEALKHNFLTRGYFRKIERQEKKSKKKSN
ncbi:MlaD family protein [Spongiivirga sp. MCCC 1A20706]|uniref:MlaD family protein n=1 Tax=Spongiivirga sp. MCCC 1A20706 TaxID=3160963 RepID=UPI003977B4D0